MNLLDAKKTNKEVLWGAARALAAWATERHGLAILRHGARKNTHWTGLEKFVKLLQAKGCDVELAVSAFTAIGAVADLVNALPAAKDDPASQRAHYRARLGDMAASMPTMVSFLRHADGTVRERAIRALLHLTIPAPGASENYDHGLSRKLRQAAIDAGSVAAALAFLRAPGAPDADGPSADGGDATGDQDDGEHANNMHWLALGLLANLTADVSAQHQILSQDGGELLSSVLQAEVEGAVAAAAEEGGATGAADADDPALSQKRTAMSTALKAAVVVVTRVTCLALASQNQDAGPAATRDETRDAADSIDQVEDGSTSAPKGPAGVPATLPGTLVQLLNNVPEMALGPDGGVSLTCACSESIGRLGGRAAGGHGKFLSAGALEALLKAFEVGGQEAREAAEKAMHALIPFFEVQLPGDNNAGAEGGPETGCVSSIVEYLQHSCAAVRCGAVRLATALICRSDDSTPAVAFARGGGVAPLLALLVEKPNVPTGDETQPFCSGYEVAAHAALCLARLSSCDEGASAAIGRDSPALQSMLAVLLSGPVTPEQYAEGSEVEDTVLHNPSTRSWGVHAIGCVRMPSCAANPAHTERDMSVNIRAAFMDLLGAIAEGDLAWRKFDSISTDGAKEEDSALSEAPPSSSSGENGALALFEARPLPMSAESGEAEAPAGEDDKPATNTESAPSIALALLDNSQHTQVRLAALRLLTALPTVQVGGGRSMLMQLLLGVDPESYVMPTAFRLPKAPTPKQETEMHDASCETPTAGDGRCGDAMARLLRGAVAIVGSDDAPPDEIWPAVQLLASLCRDVGTRVPDIDCRQPVIADLIAGEALSSGALVMLISALHSAPRAEWAQDFVLYLVCRGCVREAFWQVSEEEVQEEDEVVVRTIGRPDPNGGPTRSTWSTLLDTKVSYGRYCHTSRTALHAAAASGNATITQNLLDAGASVNICDIENITPLTLAINSGWDDLAKCLIDAGADYDAVTSGGDNVLKYAFLMPRATAPVSAGRLDVFPGAPKLIADVLRVGADPNIADENGNHPLHWVLGGARIRCIVSFCRVEIVSESTDLLESVSTLVGAGAQVNVCNKEGQTPLHIAISGGHVTAAIALTIKFGADPNVADAAGNLPLHYACASPAYEPLVRMLLEAGASRPIRRGAFVDLGRGLCRSEKLLRSLNVVLMNGLRGVLNPPAIAERQASKEDILGTGNKAGATPLHVACGGWPMLGVDRSRRATCVIRERVCDLEERCRAVSGMVSGGYGCNCDFRRVTNKEATALHLLTGAAEAMGDLSAEGKSLVRIMCDAITKADPSIIEARDAHGRSCLSCAFSKGKSGTCSSLASHLLHRGAIGETGLHAACAVGAHSDIVTRCLGDSATTQLDADGNVPLHVAAACGNASAVSTILSFDVSTIDRVGHGGNSALHLASSLPNDGGFDVVEMLVGAGSGTKVANSNGDTALFVAISRDNERVATLLVNNDAAWNDPRDQSGRTALSLAEQRNISLASRDEKAEDGGKAKFSNGDNSLAASDTLVKFLLHSLKHPVDAADHQHVCFAEGMVYREWAMREGKAADKISDDEKELAAAATKVQSSYRGHRERRRKRRHRRGKGK